MTFKSIDDVVEKVINNIFASPSDIKSAIEFLSIAKGTRKHTGVNIISMISTLKWRLSVIKSAKSV